MKNSDSFSLKLLIQTIEKAAKSIDYFQMLQTLEQEILNYEDENLLIIISFFPRSNSSLEEMNRAVGVRGYYDVGYVNTDKSIEKAIEGKARKYGKPKLPLVISINCISPTLFSMDDLELVLGKDFYRIQSNKPIPEGDRKIHFEGVFSKPILKPVAGLFFTWVTPYHQSDETWYWCENPNFEGKEFQKNLINQMI